MQQAKRLFCGQLRDTVHLVEDPTRLILGLLLYSRLTFKERTSWTS